MYLHFLHHVLKTCIKFIAGHAVFPNYAFTHKTQEPSCASFDIGMQSFPAVHYVAWMVYKSNDGGMSCLLHAMEGQHSRKQVPWLD